MTKITVGFLILATFIVACSAGSSTYLSSSSPSSSSISSSSLESLFSFSWRWFCPPLADLIRLLTEDLIKWICSKILKDGLTPDESKTPEDLFDVLKEAMSDPNTKPEDMKILNELMGVDSNSPKFLGLDILWLLKVCFPEILEVIIKACKEGTKP